jgi:hypothetical protein
MNNIEKVTDTVALQLSAALTSALRGDAFPSIDDPECGHTLLALAAACVDESLINAIGVAALGLLAQRAQLSIQAQREHVEHSKANRGMQ